MNILENPPSSPPAFQLVGVENKGFGQKWCVVCCSKVKVKENNDCDSSSQKLNDKDKDLLVVLERNLDVVFLLRNLMKVPVSQLERDLKEFGGNPEDWFGLCDKCTQLIRQARKMYQAIVKIERELKVIQELIINKTRSSSLKTLSQCPLNVDESQVDKMNDKKILKPDEIWNRTRMFVKNYNYQIPTKQTTNQIEGDKLAKYLANQRKTSSADEAATSSSSILILDKEDNNPTVTSSKVKAELECILSDDYQDNDIETNWEPETEPVPKNFSEEKKRPQSVYTSKRKYKNYEMIDGKYKCRHCDELFFSGSTCYVHEREKHPRIPSQYPCDYCEKRFNSLAYLIGHKRSAHKVKQDGSPAVFKRSVGGTQPESCNVGKRDGRNEITQTEETAKKRFPCEFCAEEFSSLWYLSRHERIHILNESNLFSCKLCGKTFKSLKGLRRHRNFVQCEKTEEKEEGTVTTAKTTSPPIEGQTDGTLSDNPAENNQKDRNTSNTGLKSQSKNKKHPSAYRYRRKYKQYERIDGKFKCRHCDGLFFAGISCYVHEREKHCTNPGQYVCDICGRKYNTAAYLITHRSSVHKLKQDRSKTLQKKVSKKKVEEEVIPPKRFTCHLCPKSYAGKYHLKHHIKFDHEKNFKEHLICRLCPDGGKVFTSKKDLIIHQFARHKDSDQVKKLREEGINVWICEVVGCSDRFITKSGLESHCKRYHDEGQSCTGSTKRFTCAFCGDGFWRGTDLRKHEWIHKLKEQGEKPFVCELCGKGFAMPKYLKQHMEVVHWKVKKKNKGEEHEEMGKIS